MLKEFTKHTRTKFSSLQEKPFLLACSGGIDSVVLAHLCAKSGFEFSIAHCNFNLRGEESNKDEVFVKELAKELKKPFFVTHFDTKAYVEKKKTSTQIAARELRYAWFSKLLSIHKLGCIVTAHQAEDAVETFLINLSRGTGIDGLTGIPERTKILARPLLKFSRTEIEAYAASENITWREDSSNADTKYIRNKIRHKIVPVLKELHPTFLDNFTKTQDFLSETAVISEKAIQETKKEIFKTEAEIVKIKVSDLAVLYPIKAYMHGLFKTYEFTAWEDITSLLSATSGKEIYSKTHRLIKDRDFLLLQELKHQVFKTYVINEEDTTITKPFILKIKTVDAIEETLESILYVAKESLKFPLTVRKWKKGDYFYPFGMQGKKRVAKFFKDEKMDTITKENQWFLCSGEEIVWVIGKRADERFKVIKETKKIIKFTIE